MKWVIVLSFCWAIIPTLPALLAGHAIGSPYTDLFPSIWSMWAWAQSESFAGSTLLLHHPTGMEWTPNSPIRSLIAYFMGDLLTPVALHNGLLIASRAATPILSYAAGKAWGFQHSGSMALAIVFGCSPFFQGYALEGVVEGVDGWPLMLWAWGAGKHKPWAMAIGLGLSVISSFYLGAACCLLAALACLEDPKKTWSFCGLLLAAPIVISFLTAFDARVELDPQTRHAMGMDFPFSKPFFLNPTPIFAKNTTLGILALGAALMSRDKRTLWIAVPIVLATGWPLLYELPILSEMRFPYRWHAATLVLVGFWAAKTIDQRRWHWLPWLMAIEGLFLSPMPFFLPGSDARIPSLYESVNQPLLDIPGPLATKPGEINPSRPRMQRYLHAQTLHRQPLGWALDFNGLSNPHHESLRVWQSWDPTIQGTPSPIDNIAVDTLRDRGIGQIMLHLDWFENKPKRGNKLMASLELHGFHITECKKEYGSRLCLLTDVRK